uniref:Uncharacterized protein n=1 Tax=Marseillevirus LCMAC101 TaxID=2506602 RepID=A0A481YR99_9VIRU|nr:MAG: hypothetical protein LCMAC101_03360 [Marseillevirus LCMAC101]
MEINQSVWDYYPKDDSYFIDPLYVPYQSTPVMTEYGVCPANGWKKQGYPTGFVNPGLVRRGWGLDFTKMHPDKDHQCPQGWSPAEDGWCVVNQPEFEGIFYTDKQFAPKYQYWDSYAPRILDPNKRQLNSFDQRSINPFTGNYVMYFNSKPNGLRSKYGHLPARDSYLA